jgi:hypothetical protein
MPLDDLDEMPVERGARFFDVGGQCSIGHRVSLPAR